MPIYISWCKDSKKNSISCKIFQEFFICSYFCIDFADVTTRGSTLGEVLRTLRILNEDNSITIFSLIGRSDLMADSF